MTLELSKVTAQVTAMGQSAAQRASARALIVPIVRDLLVTYATDAELRVKVEQAIAIGWGGAIPRTDPLDGVFDPPTLPDRMTVVAADGSQIYPDHHSLALYYVINVGSIVLRLGTGETPATASNPLVCFDEAELYGEEDYLVSGPAINARRAVAEMTRLAQLAIEEAKTAPTFALADGNIALRVQQAAVPPAEAERLQQEYIAQLDALRAHHVASAGFISRPGATAVVKLLQLATYSLDDVESRVRNYKGRPFDGLLDTALFARQLAPGQRSAVFELASQWGEPYRKTGHAICFFYLNTGTAHRPVIARVEVPEWVASDASLLGLAHGAIIDQSRIADSAYPYALTRADELAVITNAEKANFEQMIGVEMLRHGMEAGPSEKAATKAIARYGKRR